MPAFQSLTNIKPSVVTNRSAVFASSAMLGADRSVSPGSAAPSGRFRRELILDVEHAHAGVVVGGEDGFLALHRAGAVFVQVVRAERAKRTVVAVPGRGESGNRHRVLGRTHIDHESMERAFG